MKHSIFKKGQLLRRQRIKRSYLWRTFDGRVIHIRDLSDNHLGKAIMMLLRERDQPEKLDMLIRERDTRVRQKRRIHESRASQPNPPN